MTLKTHARALVLLILFIGISSQSATVDLLAQSSTFFNQRDDQYTLLGLKRAKEAYEAARSDYERQTKLFDEKLIARADYERSRQNYSDAEVNYQQSLLSVIFEQQYVTIQSAVKYQDSRAKTRVRLVVANAAAGGAEFEQLADLKDDLFRSLQPDIVHDVYVSLLNDDNSIVGLPYEAKIEELRYGKPQTLDFSLLQEADAISVNIIYGRGSERRLKVYLQKDASVNKAEFRTEQFSQEVELGGTTDYAMSLELFSGEENTFKLEAVNLPDEINRYFVDSNTSNRLSQFQFTEGVNTRQVALRLFLPDRPTESVLMDQRITFYAVSIPRDRADEIGDLREKTLTEDELKDLNVGFVRLELVPRGVGEILVRLPQLFHTIKSDETVEVSMEIVNDGTRRLDNVRVEVDPPLNWTESISPDVIPVLDINEEGKVILSITPPVDIGPGRYEVRIRTTSLSDDQPIRGADKTLTIQIEQDTNIFGTIFIVLLIVGLVVGIVIFGIRLSRR
jgi:NPCBM-associated, NEW3 domain of alpha-galactosidase